MNKLYFLTPVLLVLGCSSEAGPGSAVTGSGGGNSQASGGARANSSGGSPALGKSGGAVGSGGKASGSTSGGAPGSGGTGAAVGGSSNANGGAPSGDLPIAAVLNYRWEAPCKGANNNNELCGSDRTLPDHVVVVGGDPQTTYKITLHFRGLTEAHTFTPQVPDSPAPHMIKGSVGTPNVDAHTKFWLEVAQPTEKYYANAFSSIEGEFDHRLFALDYMADITVQGGATVAFKYTDDNTEQSRNFNNTVVPGVPPDPNPFDGQFLQVDVVSVAPMN